MHVVYTLTHMHPPLCMIQCKRNYSLSCTVFTLLLRAQHSTCVCCAIWLRLYTHHINCSLSSVDLGITHTRTCTCKQISVGLRTFANTPILHYMCTVIIILLNIAQPGTPSYLLIPSLLFRHLFFFCCRENVSVGTT